MCSELPSSQRGAQVKWTCVTIMQIMGGFAVTSRWLTLNVGFTLFNTLPYFHQFNPVLHHRRSVFSSEIRFIFHPSKKTLANFLISQNFIPFQVLTAMIMKT
jgi:hypothetical protein